MSDARDFASEPDAPLFAAAKKDAGPFDRSRVHPSVQDDRIARLIYQHWNYESPISIAKIIELASPLVGMTLSERAVKESVERLVTLHRCLIGARRDANRAGYFWISNEADRRAAVAPYKSQIISMLRRLRVLDAPQAYREFLGQIRLEE